MCPKGGKKARNQRKKKYIREKVATTEVQKG